jgi:hypothetical protein
MLARHERLAGRNIVGGRYGCCSDRRRTQRQRRSDCLPGYGYSVCDRVATKIRYNDLVNQVGAELDTSDPYQSTYLINQAVNELCPANIWQLRQSVSPR